MLTACQFLSGRYALVSYRIRMSYDRRPMRQSLLISCVAYVDAVRYDTVEGIYCSVRNAVTCLLSERTVECMTESVRRTYVSAQ